MKEKAKIKRLSFLFLIALATLFCFSTPIKTVRADSSDSVIIQLIERHEGNQINIDVRLISNSGISAMLLRLDYSKEAFEYMGFEQGSVFNRLELVEYNPKTKDSFLWGINGDDLQNDESTGVILKLSFKLKDKVSNGKYSIGFNDIQIQYFNEYGNPSLKSAIVSKPILTVVDNQVSAVEKIVEEVRPSEPEQNNEKTNAWLIAVIVASSVSIVAFAVLISIKIIRKKRGDNNWSKI